ncbi:ORF6C domain-containing protein [Clostridium sp. YIM B02505]|uniref:ORF6C domain-containing protein n=1 Tax=Clostridium yunnanense TaxID=2800325 RepID=A0ABS1ELH7_9CLOT|nr:ORF6C domain-containing protein [Clostridium yunnanense]MBK1810231.1 ORF6C domain-containing protein [Clostridium yunnanense]
MDLQVIENNGQRVLTTQQLADSYETSCKRIYENYNCNKDRYIEGKHYYYLQGEELKRFLQHVNYGVQNSSKVRSLYLWTEKGALLHAKSLNTDKAWQVYDYLIDDYFNAKDQLTINAGDEFRAISLIHSEFGELINATLSIKDRVDTLEQHMTIDYGQQLVLQEIAKVTALRILGGKDSYAYKHKNIKNSLFSAIWRDYKQYFEINSYRNTPAKEFEKAKEYLSQWKAQGRLLRDIDMANSSCLIKEIL